MKKIDCLEDTQNLFLINHLAIRLTSTNSYFELKPDPWTKSPKGVIAKHQPAPLNQDEPDAHLTVFANGQ